MLRVHEKRRGQQRRRGGKFREGGPMEVTRSVLRKQESMSEAAETPSKVKTENQPGDSAISLGTSFEQQAGVV